MRCCPWRAPTLWVAIGCEIQPHAVATFDLGKARTLLHSQANGPKKRAHARCSGRSERSQPNLFNETHILQQSQRASHVILLRMRDHQHIQMGQSQRLYPIGDLCPPLKRETGRPGASTTRTKPSGMSKLAPAPCPTCQATQCGYVGGRSWTREMQ